jgi:uncharacterized protein (DUF1800 family)
MSFTDLAISRLTFGARFAEPSPVTATNFNQWLTAQLAAPVTDDMSVLQQLALVKIPITLTAADGTSTTTLRALNDLFLTSAQLWVIPKSDTSANTAESRRPADEVTAARWVRAQYSPWQLQEVMVDFWHNHFSVDAYQSNQIALMWPVYDTLIRANALGNFRAMLGATAKSVAMMNFLNQNASVAAHPNENYAREVMELHTLGIGRYLGLTTPPGLAGTGYSDEDVTSAARLLTGWTIADGTHRAANGSLPNTGDFLFSPSIHDNGVKQIFGHALSMPGQAEGEWFFDQLAAHPGTALTVATKLYVHFVQDFPPANDPLIQTMAGIFQKNVNAPNQIALVMQALITSSEFAASAGKKVKTPFEFLISAIRATGAVVNPQPGLSALPGTMGAPLFQWGAPNGMPDIASVWTGTSGMIDRWSIADRLMSIAAGFLPDSAGTIFAEIAPALKTTNNAVNALVPLILGSSATAASTAALMDYAASKEVLGGLLPAPAKLPANWAASVDAGLRRLVGAIVATPEFQIR